MNSPLSVVRCQLRLTTDNGQRTANMRFDILTLFPEMFSGPLTESIIKRAIQAGQISVALHDIRDYTTDKHHTTDDAPYGGGAGMVMKAEPLAAAIRAVLGDQETRRPRD